MRGNDVPKAAEYFPGHVTDGIRSDDATFGKEKTTFHNFIIALVGCDATST
jgi:hypothetical protein